MSFSVILQYNFDIFKEKVEHWPWLRLSSALGWQYEEQEEKTELREHGSLECQSQVKQSVQLEKEKKEFWFELFYMKHYLNFLIIIISFFFADLEGHLV